MNWDLVDAGLLLEIVGINLVLSGDNAVVVGLVVRELPDTQRKTTSIAGITGAVILQTAATLTVAWALRLPEVSFVGGILVAGIAIRLMRGSGGSAPSLSGSNMYYPIVRVIIAYLAMCPDNILAVAAVAKGHPVLLVIGLPLSCIPLIPGSLLIAKLMKQYSLLVIGGAATLGWTAGTMIADALKVLASGFDSETLQILLRVAMTIAVVTSPWWWPGRSHPVDAKPCLRE